MAPRPKESSIWSTPPYSTMSRKSSDRMNRTLVYPFSRFVLAPGCNSQKNRPQMLPAALFDAANCSSLRMARSSPFKPVTLPHPRSSALLPQTGMLLAKAFKPREVERSLLKIACMSWLESLTLLAYVETSDLST